MKNDWRSERRFHIFKSATGRYVLIDHNISDDWQIYTESLNEFILKIITFGMFDLDVWFEDDDFTEDEKTKIRDVILDSKVIEEVNQ